MVRRSDPLVRWAQLIENGYTYPVETAAPELASPVQK